MTTIDGNPASLSSPDLPDLPVPPGAVRATLPAAELPVRQLRAIDAFNRAKRMAESAAVAAQGSREMRLDAARRLDVLRRQHEAVVASTDESLRTSRDLLRRTGAIRTVVVHRNAWFTRKLSFALLDHGFSVLGQLDNGADAVGMVVAEQPELLLMEDPLPMMTAEQVVQEVRRYSPSTFVAVQSDATSMATLLDAGASSVFTRQITPLDVARNLASVLAPPQRTPTG